MKFRTPEWVEKYQNPSGPINNLTFKSPKSSWHRAVGSKYFNDLLTGLSDASDIDAYINDVNAMQDRHYNLYKSSQGVLGKVSADDAVQQYQQDIINNYGFVNTSGIQSGLNTNRYTSISNKRQTGDKPINGVWGTDRYYGAQTDDRRILGRITNGANDYTEEELKGLNESLKGKGVEMYLDPNTNYYKLRKMQGSQQPSASDANPDGSVNPTETPVTEDKPTVENPTEYKPNKLEFTPQPQQKKQFWSDWIPLTMQFGNDMINNVYQSELQKKMKFPLKEAPFFQHKVTNDYYARSQMQKAAADARTFAGTQNLTSDINQNLRLRNAAETQASQLESQAAQLKANTYARETDKAQQVANQNMANSIDVANFNRQSNISAWNNILNANMKRAERNTAALNSYIGNMYSSYGEYLKTKRLNEAGLQKQMNQARANQRWKDLENTYKTNISDITKWGQFGSLLDAALKSNSGLFESQEDAKGWGKYEDYIGPNAKSKLSESQKQQLNNWLMNSDNASARTWRANWSKQLQDWKDQYYNDWENVYNWLEMENGKQPLYITNQWDNPFQSKARVSPVFKKGGNIGSRLSEFTNQYNKEQQHVRTTQHKRNELIQKDLSQKLERLSREQLILLRSVFK